MEKPYNRRQFIRKHLYLGTAWLGAALVFTACKGKQDSSKGENKSTPANPCEDLSTVSKEDIEIRTRAAYVKESPMPDKLCSNCNLYIPPAPEAGKECGGCLLFKGPVDPSGYCIYWAPRA